MDNRIRIGSRRFTCLSPTLARIEFAPDGGFEDRRSIVAYAPQAPLAFHAVGADSGWDVLDTGVLQIRSMENGRPCHRLNLEIRWSDGRLMQFWRPGDRDYQNLGGTLRSLDQYGGDGCTLDGVHPATMESPDASGTNWHVWTLCEVDPLYGKLHPKAPANFNQGDWLRAARRERSDGQFIERTFNWYKDARKFCTGVLSAAGYYFLNDSESAVMDADDFPVERDRPGHQDWYFFAYGRDYKQALADFRLLSGAAPLLPHKSLGIVFSRWPAFTGAEIENLVRAFAANGYPLATIIMDMEWHKEGWGHWEFNPDLIPDPGRFFALCRGHGLDVTFNDHPLDVREDDSHYAEYVARAGPAVEIREREYNGKTLKMAKVDICDKQQNKAFREVCHTHILKHGLDYWWNDGSRGQMSGTCGQLVANKTFFEESARGGRRGMLLARYGGLGSHRYGGYFTGDTASDYDVLRLQCEFNIRAGGVGLSNISHDIGGFALPRSQIRKSSRGVEIIEPERYLRWLQFGVFNPILRFHSAPGCGSRRPDDYDAELEGACRRWLRVRHSLLPYLYTATRRHHETGVPLTRGMFLEEPENPVAYRYDQYYFGPDLLVAPVLAARPERTIYLPKGEWWEFETGSCLNGGVEIMRTVGLQEVPVYVRAGGMIPRQSPDGDLHAAHLRDLILDVYAGANGAAELYEDDGRTSDYRQGIFCRTRFDLAQEQGAVTLCGQVVEGHPLGEQRKITVEMALAAPPREVVLDGKTLLRWNASPVANRYRICLPSRPAGAPWNLKIQNG